MFRPAAAIALLCAFANTTPAGDWRQWRGPTADGAAAADAVPPSEWNGATGQNVRWKAAIPGRGSATPIVVGDRVFVVTAERTTRTATAEELPKPDAGFERRTESPTHFYRFLVLCFDRNSGQLLWQKVAAEKVPHEGHHETHSYAAGSPTSDGERLFVSFGSFGTFCYDLAGNLVWSRDLGRLNTRLGWGEAVTPVVHGDALLVNMDQEANSALYCLDARTGETRWKSMRDEKSTWSTPLVTEFNGHVQVIMNGTTRIRSHDLQTGGVIWSCGGMTTNPIPSPLRFEDAVICVSGYRGAAAVSVPLASTGDLGTTGKVNWRNTKGMPYVPSPVRVGSHLYFTEANTNALTVLDAKTGKPVIAREKLPGVSSFYSSPIHAGGRVYFTDRAGTTVVLKPGDSLDVLATNKLGEAVDASAVAVGKQLFLRGDKHLFCLESK